MYIGVDEFNFLMQQLWSGNLMYFKSFAIFKLLLAPIEGFRARGQNQEIPTHLTKTIQLKFDISIGLSMVINLHLSWLAISTSTSLIKYQNG